MKSLFLPLLLVSTINSYAFEVTSSQVVKYSIPCAISIGLGGALIKDNGVQVGLVVCATSLAVNYYNDDEQKNIDFRKEVRDSQIKLVNQVQKNNDKHVADLALFRDTLRRIIAEKIIEINTKAEDSVVKALESKDFKDKIFKEIQAAAVKKAGETSITLDKWMARNKDRILRQIESELIKKISKRGLKSSQSIDGLEQTESETRSLEEKIKSAEESDRLAQ